MRKRFQDPPRLGEQGSVQRRPDLPWHSRSTGGSQGLQLEVPQLLLIEANEISNTTSWGLKRGLCPLEPTPQVRVLMTQDRDHGQPCPHPSPFPSTFPESIQRVKGPRNGHAPTLMGEEFGAASTKAFSQHNT